MIKCCLACGDLIANQTSKLCNDCHADWKESNLGYAFWLITLPEMHKQMAKMAIKSGKVKSKLENSLLNIIFPRRYASVAPSQFKGGQYPLGLESSDPGSLAATCNKKLW